MAKPNGTIIFENDRIIAIATGLKRDSANAKTGAMIQTWILYRSEDPIAALKSGTDLHVCGDCPLRGANGKERACYVKIDRAPLSVWKAYHRGVYPKMQDASIFAGRKVRFGSYGDPVFIPFNIIRAIAEASAGWTGYTHQWRNPLFAAYRKYFMASTSSADYLVAQSMGWRTFTVSDKALDKQVLCPASEEAGYRTTCADCQLCMGTSKFARSIRIPAHGAGKKYATRIAA